MSARAGVIKMGEYDDRPGLTTYVRNSEDSVSIITYSDEELLDGMKEGDIVVMSATVVRNPNLIDAITQQQKPLKEDVERKEKENKG